MNLIPLLLTSKFDVPNTDEECEHSVFHQNELVEMIIMVLHIEHDCL